MERWYWIELIGFDNELPDFGVDRFLTRNVSTTGVSLLFSHMDILLQAGGEALPVTACSYGGHEYNRERRRQDWTATQLRGLVRALQKRGVKVFFSSFDMTAGITDPAWRCYRGNGTVGHVVSPIKRIGDRSVGDELIDRIHQTLDFYGFDGLHLADGLSSNRYSIENGDFSLSFCADSGIAIPEELMVEGEQAYAKRRAWILSHARLGWTHYMRERWAAFYDKLFQNIKKPILFNNAWARDGFEALYRYGLDYRRCHADQAFAVMIEENSATRSITAPCDEGGVACTAERRKSFTYEYALMQQNVRLLTNGQTQISLTPISDTMEQWDALRHCPTELMRSIVRRYNNFVFREGRFEACADAPLYCLSDGIPASDWNWLANIERYRIPRPDRVCGFAAVCNPDTPDRELEQFCKRPHYFGTALLNELMFGGLNLGAQLLLAEAEGFCGAGGLVVTDLNAYTPEQKRQLTKTKLPLVVIGEEVELDLPCSTRYNGAYVSVALYNAEGLEINLSSLAALYRVIDATPTEHGEIWTEPLSYKRVDACFFTELCKILNTAISAERSEDPAVKVYSYACGKETYILLSNDDYSYNVCTVRTGSNVTAATALMKEQGYRVSIHENSFTVRIPPRCMEIVRVET